MSSTTRIPKAEITGPYGYLLKRAARLVLQFTKETQLLIWGIGSSRIVTADPLGPNLARWRVALLQVRRQETFGLQVTRPSPERAGCGGGSG
jgi:hypothetical protein